MIELFNEDCMEGMKRYSDKHFDLAIVDPPYGNDAGRKMKYHANAFTEYKPKSWDLKRPNRKYFIELQRLSKNRIIWGANWFTSFLPPTKNWIVWDKKQAEGITLSMHELAFFSGDGQAKIFKGYCGANRCVVKEIAQKYIRIHPTQKPVALYRWLLKNYAKEGDLILDTHLGSGSIAIACYDMGFNLVGFEIDKDYYDAAMKRLKEHQRQGKLFHAI